MNRCSDSQSLLEDARSAAVAVRRTHIAIAAGLGLLALLPRSGENV